MKSEEEIRDRIKELQEAPERGILNSTWIAALPILVKELQWVLQDEKVDKKLGKTLKCSRCKNIWTYKGANEYCANCSKCKSTVFIKNNQI